MALVGAGPGDPGLITLRGEAYLREADVVVFDALANPALLSLAPPGSERIDAGKRAGRHKLTQDEINALLVEKARPDRLVVRLKGGDPYVFGRGAEEAVYCAAHGVRCEVVAGVTAGIAAPMAAGIPVTHRSVSSSFTLLTGHEDPDRTTSHLDYEALARMVSTGGTLCIYMGVGRLAGIARRLIEQGLSGLTPAAMVQHGTLPEQRQVVAPLEDLAGAVTASGLTAPAIVVVGAVCGIDEPGLRAAIDPAYRPLLGRRVMITRGGSAWSPLGLELETLGATVIECPTLRILPPADGVALREAVASIADYDWLVLTSANGVRALCDELDALGRDARALGGCSLAVVGESTADALRGQLSVRPDVVPGNFMAEPLVEAMLDAMADRGGPAGARVLLLQAENARPVVRDGLSGAGCTVRSVTAYRSEADPRAAEVAASAWAASTVDWVVFTSAASVRCLVDALGEGRRRLGESRLASIGPVTSRAIADAGFSVALESPRSTMADLAHAVGRASRP